MRQMPQRAVWTKIFNLFPVQVIGWLDYMQFDYVMTKGNRFLYKKI